MFVSFCETGIETKLSNLSNNSALIEGGVGTAAIFYH